MLLRNGIPLRFIFRQIRLELLLVTLFVVIIGVIDENKFLNLAIPATVPTILGTAISLLLAFRTNQGYQRWWEARIVWGAIVNDSRTLIRQLLAFTHDHGDYLPDLYRRVAHRQIAFCYALGNSLRGMDTLPAIGGLIDTEERSLLRRHDNVPNALLQLHGDDLAELLRREWVNPYQQVQLDDTLRRLCDSMGKCERIKNTVFPSAYNIIIVLFIYLFVFSLPFALVESFGLGQIPIVIVVAAAFFLIEKSAIYLQDPFENRPTDTPMTAIARTIDINLRQMIGEGEVPEKLPAEGFYLM
ncbi:hypothetical protein LEM8419_03322 [Neolewinella maritima]|uniref:Bestrophin n=1 Tax=Neolewinella maritima TaxID=1383882 RepID=A0ABM9B559_9BACT|nr:bestrophin family ion channel [Neolewinella maritima]CAH1002443.1 hypothetical protein LEM8419_03322 [Neolewinella maritima]